MIEGFTDSTGSDVPQTELSADVPPVMGGGDG